MDNKPINLIFSFDDLTKRDKAVREITREFQKLGDTVVATDIPERIKRTAGISYREVNLSFADSQTVTFCVKKSGDIFQVKINGKVMPMKEQGDQKKAVKEISDYLNKGRAAFQKKLQRAKIEIPKGTHVTTQTREKKQQDKIQGLNDVIAEAQKQIAAYNEERDKYLKMLADLNGTGAK